MKKRKSSVFIFALILSGFVISAIHSCKKDDPGDYFYAARMDKQDEDYINFGSFEGFTSNPGALFRDWAIIEKVMMPADTDNTGGWHFFRGKAWEDLEGDIAISISPTLIQTWCFKNGWVSINYENTFIPGEWYTLCLQYKESEQLLELYVNGSLVGEQSMEAMDDSNNTNNLFWGGQEHGEDFPDVGELYSETSIIIAHQAWFQRSLGVEEIAAYDGAIEQKTGAFFSTKIDSKSVSDESGNNRHGIIGNNPRFIRFER